MSLRIFGMEIIVATEWKEKIREFNTEKYDHIQDFWEEQARADEQRE